MQILLSVMNKLCYFGQYEYKRHIHNFGTAQIVDFSNIKLNINIILNRI